MAVVWPELELVTVFMSTNTKADEGNALYAGHGIITVSYTHLTLPTTAEV